MLHTPCIVFHFAFYTQLRTNRHESTHPSLHSTPCIHPNCALTDMNQHTLYPSCSPNYALKHTNQATLHSIPPCRNLFHPRPCVSLILLTHTQMGSAIGKAHVNASHTLHAVTPYTACISQPTHTYTDGWCDGQCTHNCTTPMTRHTPYILLHPTSNVYWKLCAHTQMDGAMGRAHVNASYTLPHIKHYTLFISQSTHTPSDGCCDGQCKGCL